MLSQGAPHKNELHSKNQCALTNMTSANESKTHSFSVKYSPHILWNLRGIIFIEMNKN